MLFHPVNSGGHGFKHRPSTVLWRTYSYVPHPDASGCLAVPRPWRRAGIGSVGPEASPGAATWHAKCVRHVPSCQPIVLAYAGGSGACYGSASSLSGVTRSGGAGGGLGMTKLSINTSIPKATKPQAARLRIPMPMEIDMNAMILNARVPFICVL